MKEHWSPYFTSFRGNAPSVEVRSMWPPSPNARVETRTDQRPNQTDCVQRSFRSPAQDQVFMCEFPFRSQFKTYTYQLYRPIPYQRLLRATGPMNTPPFCHPCCHCCHLALRIRSMVPCACSLSLFATICLKINFCL